MVSHDNLALKTSLLGSSLKAKRLQETHFWLFNTEIYTHRLSVASPSKATFLRWHHRLMDVLCQPQATLSEPTSLEGFHKLMRHPWAHEFLSAGLLSLQQVYSTYQHRSSFEQQWIKMATWNPWMEAFGERFHPWHPRTYWHSRSSWFTLPPDAMEGPPLLRSREHRKSYQPNAKHHRETTFDLPFLMGFHHHVEDHFVQISQSLATFDAVEINLLWESTSTYRSVFYPGPITHKKHAEAFAELCQQSLLKLPPHERLRETYEDGALRFPQHRHAFLDQRWNIRGTEDQPWTWMTSIDHSTTPLHCPSMGLLFEQHRPQDWKAWILETLVEPHDDLPWHLIQEGLEQLRILFSATLGANKKQLRFTSTENTSPLSEDMGWATVPPMLRQWGDMLRLLADSPLGQPHAFALNDLWRCCVLQSWTLHMLSQHEDFVFKTNEAQRLMYSLLQDMDEQWPEPKQPLTHGFSKSLLETLLRTFSMEVFITTSNSFLTSSEGKQRQEAQRQQTLQRQVFRVPRHHRKPVCYWLQLLDHIIPSLHYNSEPPSDLHRYSESRSLQGAWDFQEARQRQAGQALPVMQAPARQRF